MMTINKLLEILRKTNPDNRVYLSFCRCVPTVIGSWRGIYAEPALGWQPAGYSGDVKEYPTVKSLICELEHAINGEQYSGWKGGEFRYYGDEPLHIDNPGDYTNTEIESIEVNSYEVVIHTTRKKI